MRVPINIASLPGDTTGPLRRVALVLGCLVVALGFVVVRAELRSRDEFRSLVDQTNQLEADIQNLQNTRKEMQTWLETPQVLQIRKRSSLLNALISQKSLSWTRMFQDLESTLPGGVRIMGIAPAVRTLSIDQSQPDLRLAVASPAITPIVDFIRRLEDSPRFENPVVSDQRNPSESEVKGEVKVTLTARYVQSLQSPPTPVDAGSDDEEETELEAESDEAPQAQAGPEVGSAGIVAVRQPNTSVPGGKR